MNTPQLKSLFEMFQTNTQFKTHSTINSGHINDTFLIDTDSDKRFILQRINHNVFPDVPGLVNNKVLVSEHLLKKTPVEDHKNVLQFVKSNNGTPYFLDAEGNYWNMMVFIEGSRTFETVSNEKVAYEGGKLVGQFLNLTSDLDASNLIDVIPKFHDMSFRYEQFESALKSASKERLEIAKNEIQDCLNRKEEMHTIQNLKEKGAIPIRVTHNDTKISNILFNYEDEGIAVIDTDTVMPGVVHYDFGDAIRTICNTASEDEKDLSKVNFNTAFYKNYYKGFVTSLNSELSDTELEYLPLGAKTMIFIMAIRFLTDYLNNDIYYKTNYEDHNLVRSKNQLKLIASLEAQYKDLNS